ncbi:MAG: S-layer homology domain-containing protein [Leptolyngbyaceae cyanobacterium SM1_1_3]|nr:S-layer homology domain-containing protein [Leptolyngbyaceae cyanobacterium SM1_1_3]NJO09342.1 S-layer homology domain-containing protein [Leptolyngbyaceae cyanobacterium SL_1_1]
MSRNIDNTILGKGIALLCSPLALLWVLPAIAAQNSLLSASASDSFAYSELKDPEAELEESELEQVIAQTPSVSELSDVSPGDWAFSAVQFLIENYGCISGYPDGTFRGDRSMTRYEFAASLSACLDGLVILTNGALDGVLSPEELVTVQRLQAEYANRASAAARSG